MKHVSPHWIGLADQFLVSGCNFFLGVLLARSLGVESFGIYVIATTLLLYASGIQSSLIICQMMFSVAHQTEFALRRNLLTGFLGCAVLLTLLTITGIEIAAYFLGSLFSSLHLGANAAPLALAILGYQSQDYVRRALYAQQKAGWALLLDFLAYGGQLASLTILALSRPMTPPAALLILACTFFLSAIIIAVPQRLFPDFKQALCVIRDHWRSGRDNFYAWQLQWLGAQGVILFGAGVLGQSVAAAIRTAQNLLGPINVFFQWMDNVMPARTASHLRAGGEPAMRIFLRRVALVGVLLLGALVAMLFFTAEPLIVLLYGEAYRPYAGLVVLQGVFFSISHFYRIETYASRALNDIRSITQSSCLMAITSVVVTVATVSWLKETALMVALIFGQLVAHAYMVLRRKRRPILKVNR